MREECVSGRLFDCARCGRRVCICTHCDRGNIYCGPDCARAARRATQRASAALYQGKEPGRTCHKVRQQFYAERRVEKMTHQGSSRPAAGLSPREDSAGFPPAQNEEVPDGQANAPASPPRQRFERCSFCGRPTGPFVRFAFIRRPSRCRRAPRLPVFRPSPA